MNYSDLLKLLAILAPLVDDLLPYIKKETSSLPDWCTKLPPVLRSELALNLKKARIKK
jgi:hypothetical protein